MDPVLRVCDPDSMGWTWTHLISGPPARFRSDPPGRGLSRCGRSSLRSRMSDRRPPLASPHCLAMRESRIRDFQFEPRPVRSWRSSAQGAGNHLLCTIACYLRARCRGTVRFHHEHNVSSCPLIADAARNGVGTTPRNHARAVLAPSVSEEPAWVSAQGWHVYQ